MSIKVIKGMFRVYNERGTLVAVFKSMSMLLEYVQIVQYVEGGTHER